MRAENDIDVSSVCRLVPSLLNKPGTDVFLGRSPSACVANKAWRQAGLVAPPDEIVREGWSAVLEFLNAGVTVAVHELRLMLVGDGEVGKTCLKHAFSAEGNKARWIDKKQRTVGVDFSELLFVSQDSHAIKCQVCDCAGQEIYYFSHTMHFTRRCMYVLVWTAYKFDESRAVQELTLDSIVAPLKLWLQLLAANVPEAKVLLVGTHCQVEPQKFEATRIVVEQEVQAEIQRLRYVAGAESAATRQVLQRQQTRGRTLLDQITSDPSFSQLQLPAPRMQLVDVRAFEQRLNELLPVPKRGFMQKVKLLLQTLEEVTRTEERLCRLHAVYNGALPAADVPPAHLMLVEDRSFAVDSIDGTGVAQLLVAIEATCRDVKALPFMGERVPKSWLQVSNALQEHQNQRMKHKEPDDIGDCVIKLDVVVSKVRALLQRRLEVDVRLARSLDSSGVEESLKFWSLLGRVFVHDGHFLRDPRLVIDLLKPLVHHDILDPSLHQGSYRQQCLAKPSDFSSDKLLKNMHKDAVLDRSLLPHFAAWEPSSKEAHVSILKFFQRTYMISALRASVSSESGESAEPQRSLVTARLLDCSDGDRQREVQALADDIVVCALFHALYVLPLAHVGFIAHMMATVHDLQPKKIKLVISFARSHVCIQRGSSRCAVSMRSLSEVFASNLGSIRGELPTGRFSHSLVISSNDDGLFAFAARCVDAMMRSGSFGAHYECWLPYRSSAADGGWRPTKEDWAELSSPENQKSLSEVLSANSSDVVIPSLKLKLRDILPRRPRIFMSHTFSGDGTGECCQRIKDRLQERLLCTVWFDKAEMGRTDAFIDEMKRGVANASAFVICLSPLYLTRPNCLRQLMWAMDMCAVDKTKKLCVLPMHPSVSFAGCKAIVDLAAAGCTAQVILPVDDLCKEAPTQLQQLKGHTLSNVALSLLERLTGAENVAINAEWLKLQPWLSDAEGENWEETSQPWAGPCEGKSVGFEPLLDSLCVDVQAVLQAVGPAHPLSAFAIMKDHELQSHPPSQDFKTKSSVALLQREFPQLMLNFSEAEAVRLMLLGLRDSDAVCCIEHGLMENSQVPPSQPNPVDAVFRMAADMAQVDFKKAAQDRDNIRRKYGFSLLFIDFEQLHIIINCPNNASSTCGSVISDKDILECIQAGKLCGSIERLECSLDLDAIFKIANQTFNQKKRDEFKSVVAAYFASSNDEGAAEDVQSSRTKFFRWCEKQQRHVLCRVEGSDDALLLNALMDLSALAVRSPPVSWNDFSYKAKAVACSTEMQIRLGNAKTKIEAGECTGMFAFFLEGSIHTWNDRISSVFPGDYQWLDVSDGDLNLPANAVTLSAKSNSNVASFCWSSRGIENMLLHPTCALWFLQNDFELAAHAFREIFQRMSENFFGSSGQNAHSIVLCARNAGRGWRGWQDVSFKESKGHGMVKFLNRAVNAVLGSGNRVGSSMLVLYEFFSEVSHIADVAEEKKDAVDKLLNKYAKIFDLMARADKTSFEQELHEIAGASRPKIEDSSKAMWRMENALLHDEAARVVLCPQTGSTSLVSDEAREEFWKRNRPSAVGQSQGPAFFIYAFPRLLCFMNRLCCANGIHANVRAASRACLAAAFRVLCATPFGLDDDECVRRDGLNSVLFRSSTAVPCDGYVPCSGGGICLCCGQSHECHTLKYSGRWDSEGEVMFMRVACRVGSMGWDSHPLMELVHGTAHLGGFRGFSPDNIDAAQASYRQHLRLHIFGEHPAPSDFEACEPCRRKSLAPDAIPQVVLDEVNRLQRERKDQFQGLINAIDRHFDTKRPPTIASSADAGEGCLQLPQQRKNRKQQQLQQQQQQQQQQQFQHDQAPSSASTSEPKSQALQPTLSHSAALRLSVERDRFSAPFALVGDMHKDDHADNTMAQTDDALNQRIEQHLKNISETGSREEQDSARRILKMLNKKVRKLMRREDEQRLEDVTKMCGASPRDGCAATARHDEAAGAGVVRLNTAHHCSPRTQAAPAASSHAAQGVLQQQQQQQQCSISANHVSSPAPAPAPAPHTLVAPSSSPAASGARS
jgi:GTPase SAR1 family protein